MHPLVSSEEPSLGHLQLKGEASVRINGRCARQSPDTEGNLSYMNAEYVAGLFPWHRQVDT